MVPYGGKNMDFGRRIFMKVEKYGIYRHFKGKYYLVLDIVKHSETREELVLYRALYGEKELWVRPLSMFTSLVDRDKYPNVKQKYRFELQNMDNFRKSDDFLV
jgi:hypothetical protein